MANRTDISAILALMSNLPNCPLTGNRERDTFIVETYFMVLKDFSAEHLKAAAAQYLGTGTFFPTQGNLREAAVDLVLSASGIPTPGEAWANVQDAYKYVEPSFCEAGWNLRNEAINAQKLHNGEMYNLTVAYIWEHEEMCSACKSGGFREVYNHPIVAEAVRRLGGRDALLTDNPASDRARFIEAYKEIVARERKEVSRIPEVTAFIEDRRAALETGEQGEIMKQLSQGMSRP